MKLLLKQLDTLIDGEILTNNKALTDYSHDASIYELRPQAVLFPKHSADIQAIVRFVRTNKQKYPELSITPRSAGTDMSGAAIGDSLIIDMTKYFDKVHSASSTMLHTQPGVFMRDIDPLLAAHNAMLGCVPASRALNTIGGMVANNSAGEQSLRYGNTDKSIRELKVVLRDGNEYTFKPLNRRELEVVMKKDTVEGILYKSIYEIIEAHYDTIKNARPRSHKNSTGYNLWSIWDRETGIFDMTQLFTGSQGTLGIITDIKIAAVPKAKHSGLLLAYVTKLKDLDSLIPLINGHNPATFEGFDDVTFNLGIRYFSMFQKKIGIKEWLKQQTSLLRSVAKLKGHIPHVVLMVECEGNTYQEVNDKLVAVQDDIHKHNPNIQTEIEGNEEASAPFWDIRRASFTLLREKVKNKYAACFIDDLAVPSRHVTVFLPQIRSIIRKYKLAATIAGHFGDGNFHIIPLMDITDPREQKKLEPAMREIIPIIKRYEGTLAGEHNDGMVRGPWLMEMYGEEMYNLFKEVKVLFDPHYIFNPHKKTDASWKYSMAHIRTTVSEATYPTK